MLWENPYQSCMSHENQYHVHVMHVTSECALSCNESGHAYDKALITRVPSYTAHLLPSVLGTHIDTDSKKLSTIALHYDDTWHK